MIYLGIFAFWLIGAVASNAAQRQMGLASQFTFGDSFSGDDTVDIICIAIWPIFWPCWATHYFVERMMRPPIETGSPAEKMPPPLASKLGGDGTTICADASIGSDGYDKVAASDEAGFQDRAKPSQSGHEVQLLTAEACSYYDGVTHKCPDILRGIECRGPCGPALKFSESGE